MGSKIKNSLKFKRLAKVETMFAVADV